MLVCHIFQALWCNGEYVWLLEVVWRPSTVVWSPTSVVFSLYMKLLILPINNCFCYHPLIFISPWYTMWQLPLQPDVIFPLKWAAFSKPFFYFAFLSPCSDLSTVLESLLSNQTKIQAPLSPHINPSLVCYLQLCLIRGLLSVSISHRLCCCISNASQRLAVNVTLLFTLSSSRSTSPSFVFLWVELILPLKCCRFPLCFDSFQLLSSPLNLPSLLHPFTSPHFAPLLPGFGAEGLGLVVPASLDFHHHRFHASKPPLILLFVFFYTLAVSCSWAIFLVRLLSDSHFTCNIIACGGKHVGNL